MKILVTGGAGFIGSAVIRLAISRGYDVVNLDALTYAADLSTLEDVAESPRYSFVQADLRDRAALDAALEAHQPDAIMHLAAESHVDRSIDGPGDFIQTNIVGTYNLLEAARGYWQARGTDKPFRFHHISTDEVFGSLGEEGQFTEETPYDPRSPYSASKASSDHLVRAWHHTYGLPIVITNCSNNYGPYQFPEKFIPVVILHALVQEPIPVYGDGGNIRDWLHVNDHADALLLALEKGETGRCYNIGGENEATNLHIVQLVCEEMDAHFPDRAPHTELVSYVMDRPGHDRRYAINPERVRSELGWRPSMDLEEGIKKTVKWYLNNSDWWEGLSCRDGVGVRLGTGK